MTLILNREDFAKIKAGLPDAVTTPLAQLHALHIAVDKWDGVRPGHVFDTERPGLGMLTFEKYAEASKVLAEYMGGGR